MSSDEERPVDLQDLEEWIDFTVEVLVSDPGSVRIVFEHDKERHKTLVRVRGPRLELGKIIGRDGWLVNHIRSIAVIMARKVGIDRIDFEFEPNDAVSKPRRNGALHEVSDKS